MMTGRQFATAVARRLRAARGIEVVSRAGLTALAKSSAAVFERKLKRHLGARPSPAMLARLTYPTKAHVHWRYPPADVEADFAESFAGEFCVYNLAAVLTDKDLSFADYEANPDLKSLAPYRILDQHPLMGDGQMTVLRPTGDAADVELYFLSRWEPYRLSLSFEEYMWCQASVLGYANWQYLFCDDASLAAAGVVRADLAEKLRRDFEKGWPGEDLSEFFALARRAG